MIGSFFLYGGLTIGFVGLASIMRPLRFLGIRTRRRAGLLCVVSVVVIAVALVLPAPGFRVSLPLSRLDEFAPVYQFHEEHEIRVNASPNRVYEATKAVTASEIFLFRTLTWIRRLGRSGAEGILQSPERQPLLDVATRTSFLMLADERGREIVVGTVVLAPPGIQISHPAPAAYKALTQPGVAKATMNFLIEPAGPKDCVLKTETRVFATDASSRKHFAAYWRLIYPGSYLIRFMWLRAIKLRAERKDVSPSP